MDDGADSDYWVDRDLKCDPATCVIVDWVGWDDKHPVAYGDHHERLVLDAMRDDPHGGNWHQHSGVGVPLFSCGATYKESMRAWGSLVAESQGLTDVMDYCLYAWED